MAVDRAKKDRFNSQVYPGTCLLLYVDDDNVNQQVLDMLLSCKVEYRVLLACDQQEVEEILEYEPYLPDVVLMDNQLLDCTGIQVIAWMREQYSPDLVFVICTARSQVEATKLAIEANAKGYLCKPYTMKELLAVLSELKIPDLPTSHGAESPVKGTAGAGMCELEESKSHLDDSPNMQDFTQTSDCPSRPPGAVVRSSGSALGSALNGSQGTSTAPVGGSWDSNNSEAGRFAAVSDLSGTSGTGPQKSISLSDSATRDHARGGHWGHSHHSNHAVVSTSAPAVSQHRGSQQQQPSNIMTARFHGVPLAEHGQASYSAAWLRPCQPSGMGGVISPAGSARSGRLQATGMPDAQTTDGVFTRASQWARTLFTDSCDVSSTYAKVSDLMDSPLARRAGTAPPDLSQQPTRPLPIVHRSTWPRVTAHHAVRSQMPEHAHRPRLGLTAGSCRSAPANVMSVSSKGADASVSHSQEWLLCCPPTPQPTIAGTPYLRLGGLRGLGDDERMEWSGDAKSLWVSGKDEGLSATQAAAGLDGGAADEPSPIVIPSMEETSGSPTQVWRRSTLYSLSEAQRVSAAAQATTVAAPVASDPLFIAASCAAGVLAAPEPPSMLPTVGEHRPGSMLGSTIRAAAPRLSGPAPAVAPAGTLPADSAVTESSNEVHCGAQPVGPAHTWGPVWVRLSPSPDSSGLGHVVVFGEEASRAAGVQRAPRQAAVGCALSEAMLQAELSALRIAPGAKEAKDIAQAVQRVVNLLQLPAACSVQPSRDTVIGDYDDPLSLDDLLQVLGTWSAREALRGMGLTLSQLRSMTALQMMQHGVMDLAELEALMEALYAL
eukprot:jgi/Ulvmu1/10229/UM060_0030.1